jgi:hypothetical protein
MEDLVDDITDADIVVPSQEGDTPIVEEEELTDEQLTEQVARLKEEASKQEDPKEKRHLEQQAGWSQKLLKEREKANNLAESNRTIEESRNKFESSLVEEVYEKAIDEKYGLPYFEKLMKSDAKLAEKVAQDKWWKSAKEIILDSKRALAENGDEDSKNDITMEEMEAKAEHKIAIREANKVFNDLESDEKETAKKYFDKLSSKTILTIDDALELADMAKHYATRNRKVDPIDKEKILAKQAITPVSTRSSTSSQSSEELEKQYIALGIDPYLASQMAKVTL